jgi:hypothetical protein
MGWLRQESDCFPTPRATPALTRDDVHGAIGAKIPLHFQFMRSPLGRFEKCLPSLVKPPRRLTGTSMACATCPALLPKQKQEVKTPGAQRHAAPLDGPHPLQPTNCLAVAPNLPAAGAFYAGSRTSMPGKEPNSTNSRLAPPPVEMCLMRSATPACSTAAMESPPPITV